MKKVNFKKRVSQLMAGLFGLALMGGVMLSSASLEAQELEQAEPETWYEAKLTVEQRLNGTFIVSTCTSIPGSSCNSPGSVHRVKVPTFKPW